MGMLEDSHTGLRCQLVGLHLVGRSDACHLALHVREVSAIHAEILWDGSCWQLQDLASRNGTFRNGERLKPRFRVALAPGDELRFGGSTATFKFVDASPPQLTAIAESGEIRVADREELLVLPSTDRIEVSVFRDAAGCWIVEEPNNRYELADPATVVAAGQVWRLYVPQAQTLTGVADIESTPDLAAIELDFSVSRDGEHVDMGYTFAGQRHALEFRAHAFLLLQLAESRCFDVAQGHLLDVDLGWIHREELMSKLAIDPERLNIWVYRARQQLAQSGIRGASGIIERRPGTQQMRIGARKCTVRRA